MTGTPFVSLETVEGIVKKVEGSILTGNGIWKGGAYEFVGMKLNDALNYCAKEGYELFDTDTIDGKKIYRLKLKSTK